MLPNLYRQEEYKGRVIFYDRFAVVLLNNLADPSGLPVSSKGALQLSIPAPEAQTIEYQGGLNYNVGSFAPTHAMPPTSEVLPYAGYAGYQQPGAYQVPNSRAPSVQAPAGPSFPYQRNVSSLDGSAAWGSSSQALMYGTGVAGPSAPSNSAQQFWPSYQ
jgi:hypothetical protein